MIDKIRYRKLHSVDSTNNYLKDSLTNKTQEFNKDELFFVSADFQTEGRGHQTNKWESEKGKNLLISLAVFPEFLAPENQFLLSKSISLALYYFVSNYCENVKIKWPNDIYVNNKKIAGILIENTLRGNQFSNSIIGIGININQEKFVSGAPNPTSIFLESGIQLNLHPDTDYFLLGIILRRIQLLQENKVEEINSEYHSKLYQYKTYKLYKKNNQYFTAQILGVDDYGRLKMQTDKGENLLFGFKEIEFVI